MIVFGLIMGGLIFMINNIISAINNTIKNKSNFLDFEKAFSRVRDWPLDKHVTFQIFRQKTTTRHDINTFYLESLDHSYKRVNRGNFSKQRTHINPELFKEVNRNFLKEINFDKNLTFHKTYKGFRLFAADGLKLSFDNNQQLRNDFKVKDGNLNYKNPSEVKFTAIMDLLNGYIVDGELGIFRQSERDLLKINLENSRNFIDFEKSILTLDRGFLSIEIMVILIELGFNFVQRLNSQYYKDEISQIKTNDEIIKIKLNSGRLRGFKDPILKEKYSKELYLELRCVTVELESGTKERILTNIPPEIMSTDEIYHIYGERWIIETNYNTLKNRFQIENYTSNTTKNIKQDVYSTIIMYNITFSYYNICNKIVEKRMIREGKIKAKNDEYEYKIDFANLIRNINDCLYKMIINPTRKVINFYTSWLIHESCLEPNKIKKNRKFPRIKRTDGNRFSRSYAEM